MELYLFGGGLNSISYHEPKYNLVKFYQASSIFLTPTRHW